jgi:membrane protease YdiL (CAAX protease family)
LSALARRLERLTAPQEVFLVWATSFAAIVVTYGLLPKGFAKVAATVSFLYLPLLVMRRRGEDYRDYGVTLRAWKQDLKLFLILAAVGAPLYLGGFVAFAYLLGKLPAQVAGLISPYPAHWTFHLRLPQRFDEWVVDQIFVVALPEEFFYRGYIQTRLRDAWPQGRMLFGVRLGPAFFVTAVLFALGHLAIFQAWRLAVFFPALLFGWMREKTGTVFGSALFHAACNLYELVLAASFFGRV